MNTATRQKANNTIIKSVERMYGVDLGYSTDAQMHRGLKKMGLPSLSKLLKTTRNG